MARNRARRTLRKSRDGKRRRRYSSSAGLTKLRNAFTSIGRIFVSRCALFLICRLRETASRRITTREITAATTRMTAKFIAVSAPIPDSRVRGYAPAMELHLEPSSCEGQAGNKTRPEHKRDTSPNSGNREDSVCRAELHLQSWPRKRGARWTRCQSPKQFQKLVARMVAGNTRRSRTETSATRIPRCRKSAAKCEIPISANGCYQGP